MGGERTFDFRDMIGGASGKIGRSPFNAMMDEIRDDLMAAAKVHECHPVDIARGYVTAVVVLSHQLRGIDAARDAIANLRELIAGVEATAEEMETKLRGAGLRG
jgi:hypothetical protein